MNCMKKIVVSTLILLFFFLFPSLANAFVVNSRQDLSIDEAISDQSAKLYSQPETIFFTQITSPTDEYEINSSEWIKSIYYYSITRLGYLDIPFTYIVDRDGRIYEGRNGGEIVDPETIKQAGTVVVGYLSNSSDITVFAGQAMKQIINEISLKYGIERKHVSSGTISIAKEGEISKTVTKEVSDTFNTNLAEIFSTSSYYKVGNLKYKAEVKDVTYPSTVKSGERFSVGFTLVNKNDFPWFTSKDYIYISTGNFKDSPFAINNVWESFSKPYAVEDKTVMPEEEVKVSFDMQATLLPGKYSQKFVATKLPKNIFENSSFTISINVKKGDYSLVKVVNIPSLNVRECIGPSCKVVSQVVENQILIMLEKNVGWYRVQYSDKKSGWVYGQYIQEL